jgi:hypothetical protein
MNNRARTSKLLCKRSSRRHGGVLIAALALTIIVSTVMAAMAIFAVSHYSRAGTEADYAAALNLAEAGINYEIQRISANPANADQLHPANNSLTWAAMAAHNIPPANGQPQIPGSFKVCVSPIDEEPDNLAGPTNAWFAPSDLTIIARGTVNGVSRTIKIKGRRKGLFDSFGLYGIVGAGFNGNYIIDGTFGSNEPVNAVGNSSVHYGNFVYSGPDALNATYPGNLGWVGGGASPAYGPYGIVIHEPNPVSWPTTSNIADQAAAKKSGAAIAPGTGITWFKNNNNNNLIQVFGANDSLNTTDPSFGARVSAPPIGGLQTESHAGNQYWVLNNKAGWSQATVDSNVMDSNANGIKRYVFPPTTYSYVNPSNSIPVGPINLKANKVIILPGSGLPNVYRDYYFENITQTGSQAVLVDTANGPIRVWLNASDNYYSATDDALGQWVFTTNLTAPIVTNTTNPSLFRIYSNKGVVSGGGTKGVLSLGGSNFFPGGMYVYNGTVNSQISFGGGSVIYGSAIAGSFGGNGNPLIKFPSVPNDGGEDPSIWFGFKDGWVEIGAM